MLNNLPDINFVSTDIETLLSEMIAEYEAAYLEQTGETKTLQPGDPIRIWIYTQAIRYYHAYQLIDLSAKQNLLKYAVDSYLDNLGAWYGPRGGRLKASSAVVTVRYTLSDVQASAVPISAGKRSGPGNGVFFAVNEATEIPAGQLYIDVVAKCTETGKIGNGYTPGQINIMVDSIPYVASVTNIDISQGGSDVEDNADYRERLFLLPESFSVAGPSGAYEYFTKQYSSSIADVKVTFPSAGVVDVRFLLQDGEIPGETLISGVLDYLSDKTRRPLTDYVTVHAPTTVSYDVNLTYYIRKDDSDFSLNIQNAVTAAVDKFVIWQKSKIGRSINPSELIAKIIQAGAKRVDLTNPSYVAIAETEIAVANTISITYGGLEDD